MAKYRILPGKQFGLRRGGEIVEYEAKDAGPYVGTHLELVTEEEAKVAPPAHLARFADLNVEETVKAAKALTDEQRAELLTWERSHKKRSGVITFLMNQIS